MRFVDNSVWDREQAWKEDEAKRPLKCEKHNLMVTGCPSALTGATVCDECMRQPEEEAKKETLIERALQTIKSMFARNA
jgi:hypothetical protein